MYLKIFYTYCMCVQYISYLRLHTLTTDATGNRIFAYPLWSSSCVLNKHAKWDFSLSLFSVFWFTKTSPFNSGVKLIKTTKFDLFCASLYVHCNHWMCSCSLFDAIIIGEGNKHGLIKHSTDITHYVLWCRYHCQQFLNGNVTSITSSLVVPHK